MKKDRIRYAVVGLGHISQVAALPPFKKRNFKSQLCALVSGTPEKLKKVGKQYKIDRLYDYSEYDELLESGEVDAVYIGLPNTMHYDYAKRAIEKGIHVLCEKPLCPTEKECIELIKAAEENKVKLMTAYRLHFEPINLKVLELIKKNKIGEPVTFSSVFSYQIKDENIRLDQEKAGGAIFDIGIYCVNAARSVFGEGPQAVYGNLIKGQDKRFKEVDGTVNALLFFSEGRSAQFTASFAAFSRSYYEVVGTKGSIRVEPAYEYAEGLAMTVTTERGKKVIKHKKIDQFAAEIEYFSECILKNKKVKADGKEGLADIQVIRAIEESSSKGKLIRLEQINTEGPQTKEKRRYDSHGKPNLVGVESAGV